jgi:spore coat polysaccharide biosynthesis protein SpsF
MKIVAIVQARCGSTRFPEKIFAKLADKFLISHVIERLTFSKLINEIIIATTTNPIDDKLENWAINENILLYRGSEDNVLKRFYETALKTNAEIIVRITADDPFKDPIIIDETINLLIYNKLDFSFNNHPVSYPEGLDVEVFTFDALEKANKSAISNFQKEHVTQYFYQNLKLFKTSNLLNNFDYSNLRWTIDTLLDYKMAIEVYENLYIEGKIFLMKDIIELINKKKYISEINIEVERSFNYK